MPAISPLLSMCFNGCLVHGVLPNAIISVMLLPAFKDKAGKLNSIDNHRPIALASILSKELERTLFTKKEMYVLTNDNQFGFKQFGFKGWFKESMELICVSALKEIVFRYTSLNTSTFYINHELLFVKLLDRGALNF